jgi:DNA polymerase V
MSGINLETVPAAQKGRAVTRTAAGARHRPRLGLLLSSEHDRGEPQRSVATTVSLPEATNDSLALAKAATWGARRLWLDDYRYSKAGVMTFDLVTLESSQRALVDSFNRERGNRAYGSDGRLQSPLRPRDRRVGGGQRRAAEIIAAGNVLVRGYPGK